MSEKKFKKVVILDTVILYPEHRALLNKMVEEVVEFPSSLPESLERQYKDNPELFKNVHCYTELAANNTPLQLLMNRVAGAGVIISCWTGLPDEILRANPQLKLIIFWTHEKEHRINMKLADELGITVANVPDYGTDSVTEVVFAGLWKIWEKNNLVFEAPITENQLAISIMSEVFKYYRRLDDNEKNTRAGKFTHHFHKLGLAKFDFNEKTVDQLIPENLVENKRIGLLNIGKLQKITETLEAFSVKVGKHNLSNSTSASFYKFLIENELIFFDSQKLSSEEIQKIQMIKQSKAINIKDLKIITMENFETKKFGVIGLGRIGTRVASIAKKLGFEVFCYSKNRKPDEEIKLGISYKPLGELVAVCDVLSLHVPAHKAENLLNAKIVSLFKNGGIFINTADGNAVDHLALKERMETNKTLVFLDVYPGLPRMDVLGFPLQDKNDWKIKHQLEKHVLTYRAGWKTKESIRVKTYKMLGFMIDYKAT